MAWFNVDLTEAQILKLEERQRGTGLPTVRAALLSLIDALPEVPCPALANERARRLPEGAEPVPPLRDPSRLSFAVFTPSVTSRISEAKARLQERGLRPERVELTPADFSQITGRPLSGSGRDMIFGLRVFDGDQSRVGGQRAHRRLEIAWREWEAV